MSTLRFISKSKKAQKCRLLKSIENILDTKDLDYFSVHKGGCHKFTLNHQYRTEFVVEEPADTRGIAERIDDLKKEDKKSDG